MPLDNSSNLAEQDLSALKRITIAAHIDVCKAQSNVLDSALRAGAALLSAIDRKLVPRGKLEDLYREVCGNERVGRRYVHLARNRAVIDATRTRESGLSMAAALALIRKANARGESKRSSSAGPKTAPAPTPRSLDGWTDAEIAGAVFKLGPVRRGRVASLIEGLAHKSPSKSVVAGNMSRTMILRRMKLGDEIVDKLAGTSLDRAEELDELVKLNRGAPEGELTPIVKDLVARAIAGEDVSALKAPRRAIRLVVNNSEMEAPVQH